MTNPEDTEEIQLPRARQPEKTDYSSLDDETFYSEYFLPEYMQVVDLKRGAKALSGPLSEASHKYKNAENELLFNRKDAEDSLIARKARDNYVKAEKEYSDASRIWQNQWHDVDGDEEYEHFIKRSETDNGSLGKLYKLTQERRIKYRKAQNWLEDAVGRTPEVQSLKSLSKRSYREYKLLEKMKEDAEGEARVALSELDKDFLERGLKIKKAKDSEVLAKKRAGWQSLEENGLGTLYEEQKFDSPGKIDCSTGEVYFAIDYGVESMKPTEDRVLIAPNIKENSTFIADIDGMGGFKGGALAAECLGRSLQEDALKGVTGQETLENASRQMFDVGLEEAGACYASVKIEGDNLDLSKAGDVKIMIIREGRILYSSVDEGRFNVVSNAVRGLDPGRIKELKIPVREGDIVVMASDGITDNLYPHGYNLVKKSPKRYYLKEELEGIDDAILQTFNKNGDDLAQTIKELGARTAFEMGIHGDGKADHRSLVVYRHGKKKTA